MTDERNKEVKHVINADGMAAHTQEASVAKCEGWKMRSWAGAKFQERKYRLGEEGGGQMRVRYLECQVGNDRTQHNIPLGRQLIVSLVVCKE